MPAYARYPSLDGRVVLISGGATGIGASLVEHFAEQGAQVAFVDIARDESVALADRLAAAGRPRPLPLVADIRDIPAYRRALAEAAAALGPIRVLVNNAARDDRHRLADLTPEQWDELISVNLKHHVFAAQAVAPRMRDARGGAVINLGSVSWI